MRTRACTCTPDPRSAWPSTKAFTGQVLCLAQIAVLMGRMRDLSRHAGLEAVGAIQALPALAQRVLQQAPVIEEIASELHDRPQLSCSWAAATSSRWRWRGR